MLACEVPTLLGSVVNACTATSSTMWSLCGWLLYKKEELLGIAENLEGAPLPVEGRHKYSVPAVELISLASFPHIDVTVCPRANMVLTPQKLSSGF